MSDFTCNRCTANPEQASDAPQPMSDLPFGNDYWKRVQAVTCSGCWAAWKDMEVKIINEYRLNLLEREHRKMLKKHMHDFLDLAGQGTTAAAPEAVASEWTPEG